MVLHSLAHRVEQPDPIQPNSLVEENRIKFLTISAIFATVFFWASAFPAIRIALTTYTPAEIAFLRYVVASIVLVGYAFAKRMPMPRVHDYPLIAISGFIGFTIYNLMLNAGEVTVSAGLASFIISSEVGVIALLARLFFGERLGREGWIGVVLSIIGVGIIALGTSGKFQLSIGALYIFIATLSISFYSVMQKPLLRRYSPIQFTTYTIWAGTVFLFFFAPRAIWSATHAPIAPTLTVVYMGLFPGVIAYIAWSYVLSKIPASQAGSYLTLIPVVALLISWLWLNEMPTLFSLIGGAVVLSGLLLINRRKLFDI